MIGTGQIQVMTDFYTKLFDKPADMSEDEWSGWQIGSCFFAIGSHSEIQGTSKEPQRILLNFETSEIESEFNRIKELGAQVIKEPYGMEGMDGMQIATFADPDGNYFQLMTPWKG